MTRTDNQDPYHHQDHGETGAAQGPPPPPVEAMSSQERTLGMLCHLLGFSGIIIPFGHILGPLILWLVKKDEMPYVDREGKEALNFQISFTLWMVAASFTLLVLIGVVLLPAVIITWFVLTILATVRANDGEGYRYPLTLRLIS